MVAAHIFASCHMSADPNEKRTVEHEAHDRAYCNADRQVTKRYAFVQFLLRNKSHRAPLAFTIASAYSYAISATPSGVLLL
jgi:hypothetical protein